MIWSTLIYFTHPLWDITRWSATSWRWTSKVSSTCCGMRSCETCEATTGRFGAGQKCDWDKLTICFDSDHSDQTENHSVYHSVIIVMVMKITMIIFKKHSILYHSCYSILYYNRLLSRKPMWKIQLICRPCSLGFTSGCSYLCNVNVYPWANTKNYKKKKKKEKKKKK